MNKYLLTLMLGAALILGACSANEAESEEPKEEKAAAEVKETAEKEKEENSTEESGKESEESAEASTLEATEEEESTEEPADESNEWETSGEAASSEGTIEVASDGSTEEYVIDEDADIKVSGVYSDPEINFITNIGPIAYDISNVELVTFEVKSEELAAQSGLAIGDQLHGFVINMGFENTIDDDLTLYPPGITVITNTKEQLQSDFGMSDSISGDFLGQVRHEGALVYLLEKSTVQELETLELRISPPYNSDYDELGEEARIKIMLNKEDGTAL